MYVGDENKGKGMYQITRDRAKENIAATADGSLSDQEIAAAGFSGDGQDTQEFIELSAASNLYYVEVQNVPVYIQCTCGMDFLRKYVFNSQPGQDNASNEFAIRVDTVLANEVTYQMVEDANLVYLEDGSGIFLNQDLKKRYLQADESGNAGTSNTGDGLEDMEDTSIAYLLHAAVENSKPFIVDYGIVTNENDYKDTKYQKLAMAFLKEDLAAFYRDMAKSDDPVNSILMNVGQDSKKYPNKADNNYHYVNRNVYMVNGSPLVGDDFAEAMNGREATSGFGEVLAAIRRRMSCSPTTKRFQKISARRWRYSTSSTIRWDWSGSIRICRFWSCSRRQISNRICTVTRLRIKTEWFFLEEGGSERGRTADPQKL